MIHPEQSDEPVVLHAAYERLYAALRAYAGNLMRNEPSDLTLSATALTNQAYLKMSGSKTEQAWDSDDRFFGDAAVTMRRILIDYYRRKRSLKRGGQWNRLQHYEIHNIAAPDAWQWIDFESLHAELDRLEVRSPELAEVVLLRFFAGLKVEEIAILKKVSRDTITRRWMRAKAILFKDLLRSQARRR